MRKGNLYYPRPRPYNPNLGRGKPIRVVNGKTPTVIIKPKVKKKSNNKKVKTKKNYANPISLYDPRNSSRTINLDSTVGIATTLPVLSFDVNVSTAVFNSFPMSLVSLALQKGWQAGGGDPNYPAHAYTYFVSIMQSFAQGSAPTAIDVPVCIALVLQAIGPRGKDVRGGKVFYRFVFPSSTPTYNNNLGPTGGNTWTTGVPDTTTRINNLWYIVDAPSTYTLQNGEAAWQSLCQFIQDKNKPAMKMVSCVKHNAMSADTSAFTVVTPNPGGGANGVGGASTTLASEVAIKSPMFASFYSNVSGSPDLTRYPVKLRQFGGDGMLLGSLATLHNLKWLHSAIPPRFKFADLNEFIDVYALVLLKAVTLASQDPTTSSQLEAYYASNPGGIPAYVTTLFQCPITFLEFKLLLRAVIMNALSDTQWFVQGIFPRSTITDTNAFTACISSANTCPIPCSTYMNLPGALIENIRSFTFNINEGNGGPNVESTYPVLGIYNQDDLLATDYVVQFQVGDGGAFDLPLFYPMIGETDISLIDGSAGGQQCFINDPARLASLATMFNDWVNTLSPFISDLSSLSTDAGINVLTAANVTAYWYPVITADDRKRREYYKKLQAVKRRSQELGKKEMVIEPKPDWELNIFEQRYGLKPSRMHLSTSPYATRNLVVYTFRYKPLKAVWENIQQYMILPIYNGSEGSGVSDASDIVRIGAALGEFNQIVTTDTVAVSTIAEKHDLFASQMVFARNSPQKSMLEQLRALNLAGRGSIFTDFVSAFSGAADAVGSVARAVTPMMSMMPI